MVGRREMKNRARQNLRRHYWMMMVVCLVSASIVTEFYGSLQFLRQAGAIYRETKRNGLSAVTLTEAIDDTVGEVVRALLDGDVQWGAEQARAARQDILEGSGADKGNPVFGRSRGVLAAIVNSVASGEIFIDIIATMQKIGISGNAALLLLFWIAAALAVCVWFFLTNMYRAVSRRFFLECRVYEDMTVARLLFFVRMKKWVNVSIVMFMSTLLYTLWSLTIIGAFVKRYSYYLTPYIVAENPGIGWRDAVTLSRRMMRGHKWECFMLELSFFPWLLLGMFTLGFTNVVYVNPYQVAVYTEYYAYLRRLAKEASLEKADLLNDVCLFEKAERGRLEEVYADITALERELGEAPRSGGIRGFISGVFGISLYKRADEQRYEEYEERRLRVESELAVLDGRSYPDRLFPGFDLIEGCREKQLHYMRRYSVTSLILLFFLFSCVGWLWEVGLHLIQEGEFINRGTLHGPWLPIYGSGCVLILVLLNRLRSNPRLEFLAAVVLCGGLEYFTGYYLELMHGGEKWWDYSGYFLNLHGRICAEGLLVFGLGGIVIVYFLAPLLDNFLQRISNRVLIPLCALLLVLYSCDQIYSLEHPNPGESVAAVCEPESAHD